MQTFIGRYISRTYWIHSITLIVFCLSILWANPILAQGVSRSFIFGYTASLPTALDVKQYALEMVTNPATPDEQVMAGTIYRGDSGVYSSIHFLRIDSSGTLLTSTEFESDPDDMSVDVHDYIFRSVDIAAGTDNASNNTYFITCLGQKNNSPYSLLIPIPPFQGEQDRDIIRIIATDDNGSLIGSIDIKENSITGLNIPGYHLEPLNSLYIDRGGTKTLYICGYTYLETLYATTGINGPVTNFRGPKKSFIIAVDVTAAGNMMVLKGMTYNTLPLTVPGPNNSLPDFDIAMRVREIKNGPYATITSSTPGIFVTGSGNVQSAPSNSVNRSATLVYVINTDVTSINFLTLLQDVRVIPPHSSTDGSGEMEYGIDMVEDGNNNRNYVISNKMPNKTYYSNDYSSSNYYNAMDPDPIGMYATEFDQTFSPNLAVGRAYYDNIWGLQTLNSITQNQPQPATQYTNLIVAGFMNKNYVSGSNIHTASNGDIKPYLFDFGIDLNATTKTTEYSFTCYNTVSGTGIPGTDLNNYFTYGSWANGSCNIYWNPVFAARGNDLNMVYMGTPKWYNSLRMKWIRAYAPGPGTILYSDDDCSAESIIVNAPSFENYWNFSSPVIEDMSFEVVQPNPTTQFIDSISKNCVPGDAEKTNKINDIYSVYKITMYPNPTNSTINLSLADNVKIDNNIKIQLVSIQGQIIYTLFDGIPNNYSMTCVLPDITTGLYIAKVYAGNILIHQQKISIEH